jgi:hypothetical protein
MGGIMKVKYINEKGWGTGTDHGGTPGFKISDLLCFKITFCVGSVYKITFKP